MSGKKRKCVYVCADHKMDLMCGFGIDVEKDSSTTHPSHFCQSCKAAINNKKRRGVTLQSPPVTWQPHSETCETCKRAETVRAGGRPVKDTGRPAAHSRRSLISHVSKVSLPSYQSPCSEHSPQSVNTPAMYGVGLQDLTCSICLGVVDQPVELTLCSSLVCAPCLTTWLFGCGESLPCPCCHRNLSDLDDIRRVSDVVKQLMEGLLVSCTCGETVRNGQYRAHAAGDSTDVESSVITLPWRSMWFHG